MPIKSGNTSTVLVLSTDTTLLNPTTGRAVITSAVLHEQTGAAETVELFISANSASAAGERIDRIVLAANETNMPLALGGLAVPSGYYLIGKATTGSLAMMSITYTQYTGAS